MVPYQAADILRKFFYDWMTSDGDVNPEVATDATPNYIVECFTRYFGHLNHNPRTVDDIKVV